MKISVITATYNSDKTLESTIISILNQTFSGYEYIIIDGGSTDNTLSIIKKYKKKFNGRLKYISEKDNGLYDAINKGINLSQGDIIGILNSDDFYTSNFILENIASVFNQNKNIDAIYGDIHFINGDNVNKCVRYYSSKIFKRSLMPLGFMPAHPSFYIRKECHTKYGLYKTDYKIAADFEFLLRIIYKHKINIKYLPIDMVTMRTGGVSTSGYKSIKTIMNEHLKACKENNVYTNRIILSFRYLYKITEFIFNRNIYEQNRKTI